MWSFVAGAFHLASRVEGSSMWCHVSVLCSFSWLSNTPLSGYTTFYLSIHQLIDIMVVSTLGIL